MMEKPDIFHGAPPYIFKRARQLRKTMTLPERMLWQRLKKRQLKGYKFRRQHPMATFIADFYCHSEKLVVEIDGDYHNQKDQKNQDRIRSQDLDHLGITVIRFTNDQIMNDIEGVLKIIETYLS